MVKEIDTVTLWHRHSTGDKLTRDQYVQLLIDPKVGEVGTNEMAAILAQYAAEQNGIDESRYENVMTGVEVCYGHPGNEPVADCRIFLVGPFLLVRGRVWKLQPNPEASIRAALV